jgi:NADH:ubiquinone oxidoreductase subunit H
MAFKLIIVALFASVIFFLGSALFHLVRGRGQDDRTVISLTWRIGLSVALFVLLFIAAALGWIHPHGVSPSP